MTRIVLDTNTLISRFLGSGPTIRRLFDSILKSEVELLVSDPIVAEYRRVLFRPGIVGQHKLPAEDVENALVLLGKLATVTVPTLEVTIIERDPSDNKFIEAAVAGNADFIVSGDNHLLELGEYEGIQIVTPAIFVAYLDQAP